jgi:protocatechuate 3,4-dioxygenase beta subunit
LTPQSLYGPYWIEGQPNRSDIRDCQEGIYLHLAMQIIDIATCKPLPHAQVDVWHANATGQYSLTKGGFLRGWQPTSKHGTVEFDTNFPGHYTDRATHIHTVVRAPNEQRVAHFGQIYFDQWLRDVLEQTTKYKGNQQPLVENLKDDFLPFDASDKHDPFVRWSRIGNSPYGESEIS